MIDTEAIAQQIELEKDAEMRDEQEEREANEPGEWDDLDTIEA